MMVDNMELYFSIQELRDIELRVDRSIKTLSDFGTIIGEQHNLIVIKKLVEENKFLREELLRKNTSEKA
jgi:hypothetical protein